MLTKKILYGKEAREKLIAGIDKQANAVKTTLGPQGSNVIIAKNYRMPFATKDGYNISKEVFLEDPFENVGSMILKEATQKSVDQAGDGTTTATILAQFIITEGAKALDAGANRAELKAGIEKSVKIVVGQINNQAVKITTPEQVLQVATIAANNDTEIGKIVADAIERVGADGLISISESQGHNTVVKIVDGMKVDSGLVNPHFKTNDSRMICELDNPFILISEKKITVVKDIMPVMEYCAKNGRSLLIFADDFEGEALATMVLAKVQGKLRCCAVRLPASGSLRKELIEDIVSVTGATVVSPERGKLILADVRPEHMGNAQKVTIDKDSTIIVGNENRKEAVQARVEVMKQQLDVTEEQDIKNFITVRIAKLTGGIAVVLVGGATEIEIREKKDRVDDAIRATQSALQEGVVPGGGICLLNCAGNESSEWGPSVIREALFSPIKQMIQNSGLDFDKVFESIKEEANPLYGYNFLTGEYGDMIEMGIIDSAKVVRCALENAASVSVSILMADCVMVEQKMPVNEL